MTPVKKVLVVDDEPFARVALIALLQELNDIEVVGEANSVETAVRLIRAYKPDLLFLDVRMRDGLGFDVLSQVAPSSTNVIFVTAHASHALRAFEVDAVDYLVKPVRRADLARALVRADRRQVADKQDAALESSTVSEGPVLSESPYEDPTPLRLTDRIRLQRDKEIVLARVSEIRFLRAARDYTEVHLASGRCQTVKQTLASWEARLPEAFARIHRSLVVNLRFAISLSVRDGKWELGLEGGDELLPVSRRLVRQLKARLPES